MVKKVDSILKEVLEKVKPSEEELKFINENLEEFIKQFNSNAKKLKINAEAFIGGSFAKKTVIKKDYYDTENRKFSVPQSPKTRGLSDADVFVRFNKKYNEEKISKFTKKILNKSSKGFKVIHGSRDYFSIMAEPKFFIELIPVIKVDNPRQALNITDLSYSHVNYIKRKAKGKLLNEILLAKAFCYANKCYGAESYISGFSGYSLELLICYYKSFLKMVRTFAKSKTGEKIIIDIEKKYKNKNMILIDVNNSKLQSPVILIDPTFKQRNATAALSEETFERFKNACRNFLKTPSEKAFEIQKKDLEKVKKNAVKNKNEFILLEATTKKQEGDVAGSKLIKFYNHLTKEIEMFFVIKEKGFDYNNGKSTKYFFVVKSKKEIILSGPMISQKENIEKFRKKHHRTFVKGKKVFAKEKIDFSLKQFVENWKKKNEGKMREMSIEKLEIVE